MLPIVVRPVLGRLLPIEFAATDTTVLTGILWTLDLLSFRHLRRPGC